MKIEELNPFIRYASMHQNYYPQRENSICYDCRFFYVVEGDGVFFTNGEKYNVSQGFCAYLPPETHYKFLFSNYNNVKIYVNVENFTYPEGGVTSPSKVSPITE